MVCKDIQRVFTCGKHMKIILCPCGERYEAEYKHYFVSNEYPYKRYYDWYCTKCGQIFIEKAKDTIEI